MVVILLKNPTLKSEFLIFLLQKLFNWSIECCVWISCLSFMLSSPEKKMKLSIMDFFSRPDSQETAHLVTFTEEILNKKLHFLCNACPSYLLWYRLFLSKWSLCNFARNTIANIKNLVVFFYGFWRESYSFYSWCYKCFIK